MNALTTIPYVNVVPYNGDVTILPPIDSPAIEGMDVESVPDDAYYPEGGFADIEIITAPRAPRVVTATAVVERAALCAAVIAVARTVEKRSTIPILGNVLLRATDAGLIVRATDLDREITVPIAGAVESEFICTVPAHTLAKVLKESKASDTVSITAEHVEHWFKESGEWRATDAGKAVLDIGGLKVTLHTLPATDFPEMSHDAWRWGFTLPTADFVRALKRSEFAISTEETRYYLNGVYMHPTTGGDKLCFVATDGHRMAVVETAAPEGAADMPGIIIPRLTVVELLHAMRGKCPPQSVRLTGNGGKVEFTIGDVVILSKLVDGTFPDYGRVVPSGNDKRMAIDIDSMDTALKQVCILSSDRGRAVKLSIEDSRLRLSVDNPDSGAAETTIPCDYASGQMDIGFNAGYLRDILAQCESKSVAFMLADPGSPALIQGISEADAGISFVLMPMRV